ncbi:hypothetical protein ABPG72_022059 [Tetrahymena utriculariae]
MLTEVDISNLGLTKKIQHLFGFVDQESPLSTASYSLYHVQNSRTPIPIVSYSPAPLVQSYSSVSHFNKALDQFYQQVQSMSPSTLIEIVAQCIQVTNNKLIINNPAISNFQPLISFASWYLTGLSPMATQVVISSIYPTLRPFFEVPILKMAQIIEPIRKSQICQIIESTLNKIGQVFFSLIPSALLTPFVNSQPDQDVPYENSQEIPIPMEITSFQHVQNDNTNKQLPELINQTKQLNQQQSLHQNTINRFGQRLENLQSQLTNIKLNQSQFTSHPSQQDPDISSQLLHLQNSLTELLEQRISSLNHTYQQLITQLQDTISSTKDQLSNLQNQVQQQFTQLSNLLNNLSEVQVQLSILKQQISTAQDPIILIQPLIDKMQQFNNSRFLSIEASIGEWYQQQMVLNNTLTQNIESQFQDLLTLRHLLENNYLSIDKFYDYINSYVPPLPQDFEQTLISFLHQRYQLDQLTLVSMQQQLSQQSDIIKSQTISITSLDQSYQSLRSDLQQSSDIIASQSSMLQQLNESLVQQQAINEQQTSQMLELFNNISSLRQSNNEISTSIQQQTQRTTNLEDQYQVFEQQVSHRVITLDQRILSQENSTNQLQQEQTIIKKDTQQQQIQINNLSQNQQEFITTFEHLQQQIREIKVQISLIPISPTDFSEITRLISTKLDIGQFSQFSYDYSITIQQLDTNIQKLLYNCDQYSSSINFINQQLLEIDKVLESIQSQFDVELLYNLRTQLGQVKELCTAKFKILDYLEKYSYSNRILDFNHSTAIKSY